VSISIYFGAIRALVPSPILEPRNLSGNGTAVPEIAISVGNAVVWSAKW